MLGSRSPTASLVWSAIVAEHTALNRVAASRGAGLDTPRPRGGYVQSPRVYSGPCEGGVYGLTLMRGRELGRNAAARLGGANLVMGDYGSPGFILLFGLVCFNLRSGILGAPVSVLGRHLWASPSAQVTYAVTRPLASLVGSFDEATPRYSLGS